MSSEAARSSDRLKVIRLLPVLDFGGVESITAMLGRYIDRSRVELRVCTFSNPGDAAAQLERAGIPVDHLGTSPRVSNPQAPIALWKYLREQEPDVLHAAIGEAIFHGALVGKLAGVPCVIGEEVGIPARSPKAQFIFGVLYHMMDSVVAVAKATQDYLEQEENLSPDKIDLIYNCIDASYFEASARAPRDDGEKHLLAVGRLVEEKNHITLIRSMKTVVEAHPDVLLSIAGEGPLRATLEQEIAKLDLTEHVRLLGFREDVKDLLAAADVFVLPSQTEGLPLALVEAMAMRLPIISARVGGVPEIASAFGEEWLLEPFDEEGWAAAICALLSKNAAERLALGERARAIVEHEFTPAAYTARLEELWNRRLDDARRSIPNRLLGLRER